MRIMKDHVQRPRLSREQFVAYKRSQRKKAATQARDIIRANRAEADDSIDHIVDRLLRGHIMR
jgi:hypothetical protein